MKIFKPVLYLFLLLYTFPLYSQVVSFPGQKYPGHLGAGDTWNVAVAAPLDTNTCMSDSIFFMSVVNNSCKVDTKLLTLAKSPAAYADSLVVHTKVKAGLQALFFRFPDSLDVRDTATRAFSAFVTGSLSAKNVVNVYERHKLAVTAGDYATLITNLTALINGPDGVKLINALPAGLKCMTVIDFFGMKGFKLLTNKAYVTVSQYEFKAPAAGVPSDVFIRDFTATPAGTPLYDLMSAGWQMTPPDFSGGITALQTDAFAYTDDYQTLKNASDAVNKKIIIKYQDSQPDFRRIILFINN